ncbi:MAG: alkaline phosphatase family protein [Promethearchaeota archaeon]
MFWCILITNIILGIDGGCFESIQSLLEKNLLPNFKKLLDEGFSSKLKVTLPPVTIPSWPCLFSGLTPEELGYYFFDHPKKGLFNSYEWQNKSIFSLIKLRNFVLNVPGTYPAWKINGEMIAGMMSPKISCFPSELKLSLSKDWIIDGETLGEIFRAFNIKKRLFLEKLADDFDLMTYVIRMPDTLSHHTHLAPEIINNYISLSYKKIDVFLGEILNHDNFENILIISDHGLKFYGYEFNLRRWLEKKCLLFINKSKGRKLYSIIAKLYDLVRPFIKIDYKKYHFVKKSLLKNVIDDSISIQEKEEGTRVINFLSNIGGLYLEDQDKNKKDIIKNSLEKDKRVREVISCNINGFPDLFIKLNDKYIFNHESSFFVIRGRNTINHSEYGFFIAYGKDIRKGYEDNVNYIDISPTILKLCKIKTNSNLQGKPIDIFK